VLQNHAHSTFTDFGGVGRSLSHSLIFSRVEASTKPGAIHDIEKSKIACARKFFAKITSDQVKYQVVDGYGKLMELVK